VILLKTKIGDTEYTVMPIPPYLSPYSTRIGELLQKRPQTVQEAEEMSKEIKILMEKLLKETVKPEPSIEHQTQIFKVLCNHTNDIIQQAQFFRAHKGSSITKSSAARSDPASETK